MPEAHRHDLVDANDNEHHRQREQNNIQQLHSAVKIVNLGKAFNRAFLQTMRFLPA